MSPWKIIFLLVVLNTPHDDQHDDCRHNRVHLNGHPHHDHVCHPVFDMDHLKYIKMNEISGILGHHVDPGAPLSSIDLAKLLMNDSSTKVRNLEESIKEKKHTPKMRSQKTSQVLHKL